MSNVSVSSLASVYAQLTSFANLSNFWSLFNTAFGSSYDFATAASFRSQWQSGDFSLFPQIEVVSGDVLGTANGAYGISTNRIYLSDQFVSAASQQSLVAVILEEFGHFVDTQVNTKDTAGDEGELFSDLVRGVSLSASELSRIKTEDDHAVVIINGQATAIEQSLSQPTIAWTKLFGTIIAQAKALTTGNDGAIYASGSTQANLDGQIYSGGFYDAFITKYNPDGTKAWAKLLGTSREDQANALTTGNDGAIYVSGLTYGNLDGQTNSGESDAFVTKYNPDGTKVWTKLLGTNGDDQANALTTGNDGAIYVSGQTSGNLDGQTNSNSPNFDAFITKYNPDGTKVWTKLLGTTGVDQAFALTTGNDGAIYVSGVTNGNLDGQTNSGGFYDVFITKYNPDGTKVWTKLLGSGGQDFANALTTGNDGAIYVSGYTDGNLDGQTNSGGVYDAFVTKYNPDGTKVWTKLLGSGSQDLAFALTTGNDGAIYVSGITYGNLDGQTNNSGSGSAFITKYQDAPAVTITLAVAPASVTEDGTPNLVYTFTRTGDLTNALTVNYGITGTATNGTDYATIGTNVTFAANSATAIVTVNPTADTTIENNETVALTLATGIGYIIGTTTAITGTITNDDVATVPNITLAVAPVSVLENGTPNLVYTFTRTGATTNALTVNYGITGTANAIDYTGATPGTGKTITFAAGSATATLTIDPTADTAIETNETVSLNLATGTGYTIGTTTAVIGTITNDDFPTITLAVAPASVLEDGTPNLVYTFTRTGPTTSALTVNYGITGTADATDYTGATPGTGKTITFAAGSATATLTIDPTADTTIEANETVSLTLATGTGYTIGTTNVVTGTITNDDVVNSGAIAFSNSQFSINENGTPISQVTLTRTGGSTGAVSATVNLSNGTATVGNDYIQTPIIVTFADGEITKTVNIPVVDDNIFEGFETINLALTNATGGASLGVIKQATLNIFDNADGKVIYTNDFESTIGSEWSVTTNDNTYPSIFSRFLGRFNSSNSQVTLNTIVGNLYLLEFDLYALDSWDGNNENDFFNVSINNQQVFHETLTNNLGYTQTFRLPDTGGIGTNLGFVSDYSDSIYRKIPLVFTATQTTTQIQFSDSHIYTAGLNDESWGIDNVKVTGVDDGLPLISLVVSPASVLENGTPNLVYTFTRTGATTNALTVNYGITGTADATDYTGATPGTGKTITFAAGSATATLTVDPTADTAIETDETVSLTLATGTGYTVGTTTAVTGTITNDDFPTITLVVAPASVLEDGTPNLIYTFTRTGPTTNALTVNYGITGTATNGTDYATIGTSVIFAANSATATVTVNPTADTTIENNETVALTLATGTGYTIGTTTAITGTITDDDSANITLAVAPASVLENGTPNLVYTFTRTGPTTSALTVNYSIGGTATNGTDYATVGTSVIFAAGSTTATVTVNPTADTIIEDNETVALTLATGTGYTIGTTTAVTGTIANDDFPRISINDITLVEGKDLTAPLTLSLSSPSPQTITVNYTITAVDATANLDYTTSTGTLTFAANSTIATLSIPILNDNLNEEDESFFVTLSNPTNATLNPDANIGEVIITDTLQSSLTRTLPANVENLKLIGTAAINGTGNAGNNVLTGNSGNNTLTGLAGNDTYSFLANTALGTDTITETTTGGTDTLNFSGTNNQVRLNLGSITNQTVVTGNLILKLSAVNVIENLIGGNGGDRLTGNSLNNSLEGNGGNDNLSGGNGIDTLTGGTGDDLLIGGAGNDNFAYVTGKAFTTGDIGLDTLTDFTPTADKLLLSKTTFSALTSIVGNGFSQATNFAVVEDDFLAETSSALIVYSSNSGSLFYNQNGNVAGLGTGAEFAVLINNPALTSNDFILVA